MQSIIPYIIPLVFGVLYSVFFWKMWQQDPVTLPEEPTFRNEIDSPVPTLANILKLVGRKTRKMVVRYRRIAYGGLLAFIIALTISPHFLEGNLSQVLFATASVQAALGFYIYSIGNTMFTIAESMDEPGYIEDGRNVNGNATLMVVSAGGLIILGIMNSVSPLTTMQQNWVTAISLAFLNFVFFLPAVLLHGDYHRWRDWGSHKDIHDHQSTGGGLKQIIDGRNNKINDIHKRVKNLDEEDETDISDIMDRLEEIEDEISDIKRDE